MTEGDDPRSILCALGKHRWVDWRTGMRKPDYYIGFGAWTTIACSRCGKREDRRLTPGELGR